VARDFGDFQTPPELVSDVLEALEPIGTRWPRVLEPTCGRGNFIAGLLNLPNPPKEIIGLEVQDRHIIHARQAAGKALSTTVTIEKADIFSESLLGSLRWKETGPLLVVGNPPWITSAELGSLSSGNVPRKSNVRGFRGIEAITGNSNFDLTEYVWIKLLTELVEQRPAIALLCKTSVARKILRYSHQESIPVQETAIRKIDARKWFGAAVDACLFYLQVGSDPGRAETPVYQDLLASEPESVVGIARGTVVADLAAFRRSRAIDGTSPLVWRQGIKHDAASVMVLREADGVLRNKKGESVEIENDYLFPFLKGSDLARDGHEDRRLFVIVTQRRLGEPTEPLRELAPKLWHYLKKHEGVFAARKSSVFAKGPEFSMFGVGDYSFSVYKVAVAGMYPSPRFRALGPTNRKPVMLDDTCYFFSCESAEKAALLSSLLNDPLCLRFVNSLLFKDSKRPITKGILQRIDLKALLPLTDRSSLHTRAEAEFHRLSGKSQLPPEVWRDVFP
jgi:hypothetical protein